jgi:hypothetical protein
MDLGLYRELERILAVAISGMSIYLGYRLFLDVKAVQDSAGKLRLPGGIAIYLIRIGPGVFFALFGSAVIALSLKNTVSVSESNRATSGPNTTVETHSNYTGFGSLAIANDQAAADKKRELRLDLDFLNKRLPLLLRPDLSTAERTDLSVILPKAKLSLMRMSWDQDWGDFAVFQRWVDEGSSGSLPSNLEDAAKYYRSDEGR